MQVADAQRELRLTYLGGFPGGLVSGALWLLSSALGTWDTPRSAIWALCVGGAFIFPVTMLLLRLMGRRATLTHENPLGGLASQIAFTIPVSIPLVLAATLHRTAWFFPAFMIVVGAHYMPFVFLYGMNTFWVLAVLMMAGGLMIGLYMPAAHFSLGGWITGVLLIGFGIVQLVITSREQRAQRAS
ncbi:MAG TPA: hypothetical protein VJY35_06080 [Candidatus Eisenbacteria bacterium]|nr:hypothetical protein [Candidatus Eisenbacteria bacterium]